MKKLFKSFSFSLFLFFTSILCMCFFSCATTVNVQLTRPAKLDLNGAKTIAVLPIKPYAYYREYDAHSGTELLINTFYQLFEINNPDEEAAIRTLRGEIENGLAKSPYIKLINSDEVELAQKKGYLNPADVYLIGEVSYFNIDDRVYEERKLVKAATETTAAEYIFEKHWIRDVDFRFRYQIVDSRNNCVISYSKIDCQATSDNYERRSLLPSAYKLIESKIRYAAKSILKELQPYVVTKSISLLEAKTKDKALKERMKAADELAGNSMLKKASEEFSNIYKETGLVEAGYNAAILQEALGNLSLAESMMLEVYNNCPDSRVSKGLSDIRYEIEMANRLNKQIKSSDSEDDF